MMQIVLVKTRSFISMDYHNEFIFKLQWQPFSCLSKSEMYMVGTLSNVSLWQCGTICRHILHLMSDQHQVLQSIPAFTILQKCFQVIISKFLWSATVWFNICHVFIALNANNTIKKFKVAWSRHNLDEIGSKQVKVVIFGYRGCLMWRPFAPTHFF